MDWLSRFFGARSASTAGFTQLGDAWDGVIRDLRVGLFVRVYNLHPATALDERPLLSGSIMNYLLHEEPGNDKAKAFAQLNASSIEREADAFARDAEARRALQFLYAAQVIYLYCAMQMGNEMAEGHISELFGRAHQVSVSVPNLEEMCGSSDMDECLEFVRSYAVGFRQISRVQAEPD